jgi:hypothetical protein
MQISIVEPYIEQQERINTQLQLHATCVATEVLPTIGISLGSLTRRVGSKADTILPLSSRPLNTT